MRATVKSATARMVAWGAPAGTRTLRVYVSRWVGGTIRLGWAVHYWDE